MAGGAVRRLLQLLAGAGVVATAFATSQPGKGLVDPGSPNTSIVHLQTVDARRGLPCSGFFITPHLVVTERHCVMTQLEAANAALDLGANSIRGLELLVSQADLDFSLLWVATDASSAQLNFGTPIAAIRTRLLERVPLIEQANPSAATELRAALK
jgi:hypothetical protein